MIQVGPTVGFPDPAVDAITSQFLEAHAKNFQSAVIHQQVSIKYTAIIHLLTKVLIH